MKELSATTQTHTLLILAWLRESDTSAAEVTSKMHGSGRGFDKVGVASFFARYTRIAKLTPRPDPTNPGSDMCRQGQIQDLYTLFASHSLASSFASLLLTWLIIAIYLHIHTECATLFITAYNFSCFWWSWDYIVSLCVHWLQSQRVLLFSASLPDRFDTPTIIKIMFACINPKRINSVLINFQS